MNRKKITEEILEVLTIAEQALVLRDQPSIERNLRTLDGNLDRVTAAFSGSWLGYHANVYYNGLVTPQPGDSFSVEWGLMHHWEEGTTGWREFSRDEIKAAVMEGIDADFEDQLARIGQAARSAFDECHNRLSVLLAVVLESHATDMLKETSDRISNLKGGTSAHDFVEYLRPHGQFFSRDTKAISQRSCVPVHVAIDAFRLSQLSYFNALSDIGKESKKLLKYMDMHDLIEHPAPKMGSKIFIGHGSSPLWRELKDFLQDRLHLAWDEFNRIPAAGFAHKERLESMLEHACFAFLLFTAEDEHSDQTLHARENVIHEAGLFQGRLGFRKAIILLEEGCSEFGNIHGLGQIRFQKGSIASSYEEIRGTLEREGLLNP